VLWDHVVERVLGTEQPKTVTGVRVQHVHSGEEHDLKVDGLFVAIGHDPATEIFRGHVDMDAEGYVATEPGTTRTSVEGVFAAGDVQDKIYRQAVTAAGSGCMAALDAERFLAGIG
jgi:thioredoxin reductase (NADPH)